MFTIEQLYQTLQDRRRPEDVAEMILQIMGNKLTLKERQTINLAAKGALSRTLTGYTSMLQTFARAVGAGKQIRKTIEIFKLTAPSTIDSNDTGHIEAFIATVAPLIHKGIGDNNFKADRLNKEQRKVKGLEISKRSYNKKWRLLKRLEKKLVRFIRESKKVEFSMIAKHGLTHTIAWEDFAQDINSACFIAYYNARCNRRSVFTNEGQDKPFDQICDILLSRCTDPATGMATNWWAIAHSYANQEIMNRLTDEQKGQLLGTWTSTLQEIAKLLGEVWNNNDIYRKTMVVKKGNDSTTWNNTAGAWNKARDHWMHLIYAIGMDDLLDELCFGKVLRLMAADVVYWHTQTGGQLDANTIVWNILPLPWEVFQQQGSCNRQLVCKACGIAGIDPEKTGWIAPRQHGITKYTPTPELVHGIAVSSPFLATVLKKHRYFSGKEGKPFYPENN